MKDTLRLGRVAGIPLGMSWTLAVVAGLLAYLLASDRLPAQAPGYGTGAYAVAGILTAVGLFATVLAHELGHALVARRHDLPVDGITLSWIGGVTRIEGEAATARIEAVLAGAGPAVSLVVGGLLLGLELGLRALGVDRLLTESLAWLAVINLLLGMFNLIPASPLDGGRILHAGVWAVTGDRWRAGKLAASIGMGFGGLVVLAGGWQASMAHSTGATLNAFTIGLVGWWLFSVARGEHQTASVHRVLDGTRCADVMRPVLAGPGWVTVETFLANVPPHLSGPPPVWMLEDWGGADWGGEGRFTALVATEALQTVAPPLRSSTRPADVAVPISAASGAGPYDDVLAAVGASGGARIILVTDGGRTVGAIVPSDLDAIVGRGRGPAMAGRQTRRSTAS